MEYQMKIKLDKIISIHVTYEAVPMLFMEPMVIMLFLKYWWKMALLFLFNQSLLEKKRNYRCNWIFKSKGVIFKDKYHILDQLDKQEALSYYLEKYMEVKMISIACNIQECYFEIIKNTLPQKITI